MNLSHTVDEFPQTALIHLKCVNSLSSFVSDISMLNHEFPVVYDGGNWITKGKTVLKPK